jgi:hypothetical protein
MQKWEYIFIYNDVVGRPVGRGEIININGEKLKNKLEPYEYIKKLGEEGWELVSMSSNWLAFKRPKA